jgi:hydroxyethylthiazole kinase-like uncharacterized protein yjeF
MAEILFPDEMAQADRLTAESGRFSGRELMERAGYAVAEIALSRHPEAGRVVVLCGPGNNGGDGYVAARLLAERGVEVQVFSLGEPRAGSDAASVAAACPFESLPLSACRPAPGDVVIDALFGAGLARELEGDAAAAAIDVNAAGVPVIAVDLPSGVAGATGLVAGAAFRASTTVTFARLKPGHLLYPGRAHCGETIVADIGISDAVIGSVGAMTQENVPATFVAHLPAIEATTHKYRRGHCGVISGGPTATGAARLAALAAARSGAGATTVLSPTGALTVNAHHLTSIMLRRVDNAGDLAALLDGRGLSSLVIGPGAGIGEATRALVAESLAGRRSPPALVLDADALTAFSGEPGALFAAIGEAGDRHVVLTPHDGEFERLFPDLAHDPALSRLDRARRASERSGAVVVSKGADTVIAAPSGRAAINANAPPWLATAGSGDVLAGLIAGLMAQGMPAFEAACCAVFAHGEAGNRLGRGLIAEDLPAVAGRVIAELSA